jgi:hypothetical protein
MIVQCVITVLYTCQFEKLSQIDDKLNSKTESDIIISDHNNYVHQILMF